MTLDTIRNTITRRRFITALAGAASTLIAACSGPTGFSSGSDEPGDDPTATAEDARPSATPAADRLQPTSTPERSANTSASNTQAAGAESTVGPLPEGAVGRAAPASRPSLPREIYIPFAAVVSRKLQVRDVSLSQLEAVWNLRINNWRELGDPVSTPVRRYTLPDSALPLEPFGGDIGVQSIDELAEALWNDRGGIGLIPVRDVDHRFRTLHVDGVDILRTRGAPNPLMLKLFGVPEEIAPESLIRPKSRAKLTFVGDIIFGRYVQVAMEARNDFSAPFRSVADRLKESDLTIGNLECTLSDNFPQPEREDPKTFRFKTGTVTVSGLKLADIDYLGRANNHSFDFGPQGMDDTSRTLDEAGIKHFGMGHNLEEARRPAIATLGDLSFAFLAYNGISDDYDGATVDSPGTSPLIEEYVREDVRAAVASGHIVVPFFHWGIEYVALPTDEQRRFAQIAIDEGASIVIGSHPHWVQAVETYKGKAIVYSLGNFVFDQAWSRETTEGVIADLWFEGDKVTGVDLIPILIVEEHRPILLDADSGYHVLERIWTASDEVRRWS